MSTNKKLKIDLGPPMVIGAIMLAVGLALPFIALAWCAKWVWLWAREAWQDGGWN